MSSFFWHDSCKIFLGKNLGVIFLKKFSFYFDGRFCLERNLVWIGENRSNLCRWENIVSSTHSKF